MAAATTYRTSPQNNLRDLGIYDGDVNGNAAKQYLVLSKIMPLLVRFELLFISVRCLQNCNRGEMTKPQILL